MMRYHGPSSGPRSVPCLRRLRASSDQRLVVSAKRRAMRNIRYALSPWSPALSLSSMKLTQRMR